MSVAAYEEVLDLTGEHAVIERRPITDRQLATPQTRTEPDSSLIEQSFRELLGAGRGACLAIGCGTGINAYWLRQLGWSPVGIDQSPEALSKAAPRLPVARSYAAQLPFATNSIPSAVSVMVHSELSNYNEVLHEIQRVLRPGGVFVHIGFHPCFGDPDDELSLSSLVNGVAAARLTIESLLEAGNPIPSALSLRATKSRVSAIG